MNAALCRLMFLFLVSVMAFQSLTARDVSLLNDGWSFHIPAMTSSVPVHLPHCWNSDAYTSKDYYRGKGIYTRSLMLPESFQGKNVYIKFDGIACAGEVSIDGKKIGETVGGYSSHTFDITPFVRFGKDHVLTVTADNSRKGISPCSADFTFMGGVYRDAWLLAVHDLHLDIVGGPEEGFAVRSFLSDDGKWCSEVSGVVVNDSDAKAHVEVRMTVYDASGCPLCDCVKEAVG